MSRSSELKEYKSHEAWLDEIYSDFVAAVQEQSYGIFHVAVPGGNSPVPLFQRVAEDYGSPSPSFARVRWWIGDERWVPLGHPDRNESALTEIFATPEPRPSSPFVQGWRDPAHTGPAHEEPGDAERAAEMMSHSLASHLPLRRHASRPALFPTFPLILLGLGDHDGHTASLFAGQETGDGLTAVTRRPEDGQVRLTLNYPVIEAARQVWFLLKGSAKEPMIRRMLDGDESIPAGRIAARRPCRLYWLNAD